MLGTRGVRLGVIHPEIYEMQVRAIHARRSRSSHAADRRRGWRSCCNNCEPRFPTPMMPTRIWSLGSVSAAARRSATGEVPMIAVNVIAVARKETLDDCEEFWAIFVVVLASRFTLMEIWLFGGQHIVTFHGLKKRGRHLFSTFQTFEPRSRQTNLREKMSQPLAVNGYQHSSWPLLRSGTLLHFDLILMKQDKTRIQRRRYGIQWQQYTRQQEVSTRKSQLPEVPSICCSAQAGIESLEH